MGVRKPYGRFSCASSKNMGASVEDQEAPHLLIFIELAPSKNDKLLRNDLLFAFQKHGAECTGLLLIFNVAEIGDSRERANHPSYIASREGAYGSSLRSLHE